MGNCCSRCCPSSRAKTRTPPAPGPGPVPPAPDPLQPVIPGPVRNLTITVDPNLPSVTLQWSPPANVVTSQDVTAYNIRFKPSDMHHYQFRNVGGHTTTLTITREMGLVPLVDYDFEVQARNFDHTGMYVGQPKPVFVEWQCKVLSCTVSRKIVKEGAVAKICDFCSRACAVHFGKTYCLYPDCTLEKQSVAGVAGMRMDFCSDEHYQRAIQEGASAVVEVEQRSREFQNLSRKFRKDWRTAKGPCPDIGSGVILRIVNPKVAEEFTAYTKQLPRRLKKVEQHYHGTSLSCEIQEYLQLCSHSKCGVCGISSIGFVTRRIDVSSYQRFGHGFYLAPNSSKSHDYTEHSPSGYRGMFLCDVAPGRCKRLRKSTPHIQRPTDCDSIRGVARITAFGYEIVPGDLNYPELVVFNSVAIHPLYAFLYRSRP